MLYTITAASPEVDDFVLELQIESDATFESLHRLIRESCGWGAGNPATFYLCDHRWRRERAIPESGYEDDVMADVELGDLLDDEGQRMQYVFDARARRALLLEVTRIAYGKHIDEPLCRRRHGTAPDLDDTAPTANGGTASAATASAQAQHGDPSASPVVMGSEGPSRADLLAQLTAAALAMDDEDNDDPITDDDDFDPEELDPEGFDITEL